MTANQQPGLSRLASLCCPLCLNNLKQILICFSVSPLPKKSRNGCFSLLGVPFLYISLPLQFGMALLSNCEQKSQTSLYGHCSHFNVLFQWLASNALIFDVIKPENLKCFLSNSKRYFHGASLHRLLFSIGF